MAFENRESIYLEFESLVDEETALANKIFELSEKLEAELALSNENANSFVKRIKMLDEGIEGTLLAIVQKEAEWIGRLKKILERQWEQTI